MTTTSAATLEDLQPGVRVRGVIPDQTVEVIQVAWHGSMACTLTYRMEDGRTDQEVLYRSDEPRLEIQAGGRAWTFDGDPGLFRLVSEALRIRLAHLFDPYLAVHTSDLEPLPHQITAVYEEMLPRQPPVLAKAARLERSPGRGGRRCRKPQLAAGRVRIRRCAGRSH